MSLFNLKYFKDYLIGKKRNIKDLMMDQKFVSGLGNIYVNEILFLSKIKPLKKVSKLSIKEIKVLLKNTKTVLANAILLGGSSIKNFADGSGNRGDFQQHFRVYGKKGSKCSTLKCKRLIEKIVIANRASFFCPKCQK